MPGFGWAVEASVRFTGNGQAFMTRLTGAAQRASQAVTDQSRAIRSSASAWDTYGASLRRALSAQRDFMREAARNTMRGAGAFANSPAGMIISGNVASRGAHALAGGADRAGKLQLTMAAVQMAAHLTPQQRDQMEKRVFALSETTAQDAVTIAQELVSTARAGLSTFKVLDSAFDNIAKLADVLKYMGDATNHPISPVEASKVASQFSHYYGAYGGKKQENLNNYLVRLMNTQPEDMQKLVTQGKYFIPLQMSLAPKDGPGYYKAMEQTMVELAMMGQGGLLQGRGGSGMERVILGSLGAPEMTSSRTNLKHQALYELGLEDKKRRGMFTDEHGNVGEGQVIARLVADREKMGGAKFQDLVNKGLGAVAQQTLAFITSPAVQEQLGRAKSAITDKHVTVDTVFDQLVKTNFLPAMSRFAEQFNNIYTTMVQPALPGMTAALNTGAHLFAVTAKYMHEHPEVAVAALTAAVVVVGSAAVFTALQAWALVSSIKAIGGAATVAAAEIVAARVAMGGGANYMPGAWGMGGPAGAAGAGGGGAGAAAMRTFGALTLLGSVGMLSESMFKWYFASHPGSEQLYDRKNRAIPAGAVRRRSNDGYAVDEKGHVVVEPQDIYVFVDSKDPHTTVEVVKKPKDPRHERAKTGKIVTDHRQPLPTTTPLH